MLMAKSFILSLALLLGGCASANQTLGPDSQRLVTRNSELERRITQSEREIAELRQEQATLDGQLTQVYERLERQAARQLLQRDHLYMELPAEQVIASMSSLIARHQGSGEDFSFSLEPTAAVPFTDGISISANYEINTRTGGSCRGVGKGSLVSQGHNRFRLFDFNIICPDDGLVINASLAEGVPEVIIPLLAIDSIEPHRNDQRTKWSVSRVEISVPLLVRFRDDRVTVRSPLVVFKEAQ